MFCPAKGLSTGSASASLPVLFPVPDDVPARSTLAVETGSNAGTDRVERPVTIERQYRILLISHKSLYKPGQTIHQQTLALSALDLIPAGGADPDGAVAFMLTAPRPPLGVPSGSDIV